MVFIWALHSSPEAGLVLSGAHPGVRPGVLASVCLTDAANLPTASTPRGPAPRITGLGLGSHQNPLGNVKRCYQGHTSAQ